LTGHSAASWFEDRLAELDPPHREVALALMEGAFAATCSVLERDGDPFVETQRDLEAIARIRYRVEGEADARVVTTSVAGALMLALRGAQIDSIEAPNLEAWVWTSAAVLVTAREVPADLVPGQVVQRQLWILVAEDGRGLSAGVYSKLPAAGGVPLGEALVRAVSATRISGARARLDAARRELGSEALHAAGASAVASFFLTPEVISGSDGGPALLDFEIARYDPALRSWQVMAAPTRPGDAGRDPKRRRSRLAESIRSAMEADAFGTGFHSVRSTRHRVSLDAPLDPREAGPGTDSVLGDLLPSDEDPARTVMGRLALEDLVSRSNLTAREAEVVGFIVDQYPEVEIAEFLGIAPSTVRVLWHKARRKLSEALEDNDEGA